MGGDGQAGRGGRARAWALTRVLTCAAVLTAGCAGARSGGSVAPVPAPVPVPVPAPADVAAAAPPSTADAPVSPTPSEVLPPALPVAPPAMTEVPVDPTDGTGAVRWVGRDADRTLSVEDRALLRTVFGIDDVRRLFVPAAAGDVLRYAAHPPGCPDAGRTSTRGGACRVVSVRVGLRAPRAAGESWDAFSARVTQGGAQTWSTGGRAHYAGLDALDPDARPAFERLIDDARRAGFPVHVRETYRTPERQAAILARNDGRTTTLTSAHSYGRAIDVVVGDGRLGRRATYREWVAFRRWVAQQDSGAFRIIGTPERTWDWPHIEFAGQPLGYRSVAALVAAARACQAGAVTADEAAARCTVAPHVPAADAGATLVADDEPVVERSHPSRRRGSRHGGRHAARRGARHGQSSHGERSHGERSHRGRAHGERAAHGAHHEHGRRAPTHHAR